MTKQYHTWYNNFRNWGEGICYMATLHINLCPNCHRIVASHEEYKIPALCPNCQNKMEATSLEGIIQVITEKLNSMLNDYILQLEPGILEYILNSARLDTYEGVKHFYATLCLWTAQNSERRKEMAKLFGIELD